MNIYRLAVGYTEHIIAAEDEQDAYKQGTDPEKFPDIHYLPFTITQIVVPGHTITVTKDKEEAPKVDEDAQIDDEFTDMERPEIVAYLKENSVDYVPQWGVDRLRDTARAWKDTQSQ